MKKIGLWFKGLCGLFLVVLGFRENERELAELAEATLKLITAVRKVAENPALDLITELTKTQVDDAVLKLFREFIREIEKSLQSPLSPNPLLSLPKGVVMEREALAYISDKKGITASPTDIELALLKARENKS